MYIYYIYIYIRIYMYDIPQLRAYREQALNTDLSEGAMRCS